MRRRRRGIVLSLIVLAAIAQAARAQSRGSYHGGSLHHHHGSRKPGSPVTINPSTGCLAVSPVWAGWGPFVPVYPLVPPILLPPPLGAYLLPAPEVVEIPPPILPASPPPRAAAVVPRAAAPPRPHTRNAARSKELMELGDRLFRARNYIRAVERYEQAIRADEDSAEPRARLAQVALVRGKYQDAANKLREAQAAEPGWLATAGDVRGLYPEPADFNRLVAKVETHLQAHPEDRDAWLVLGALWYLSGRTQKAADVFLRLSDRREDPTLRAFLQATKNDPMP